MRFWLHLVLVSLSFGLVWLRPVQNTPEQTTQQKAQQLVDAFYGRGHAQVTVTLHHGRGQRTVRDQQLGDQALVVGSQEREESCQGRYHNRTRSEKLELPRKLVISQQDEWLEQTSVAVVVDREPGEEISALLQAGLGLNPRSGDQIQVVRAHR
ncbi:hypothetical protein JST97_22875 [bacterium]|nr:hypothetical protein [bacterium]